MKRKTGEQLVQFLWKNKPTPNFQKGHNLNQLVVSNCVRLMTSVNLTREFFCLCEFELNKLTLIFKLCLVLL